MKSRQIQESDVDDILNIYSTVEKKSPASNLEGWSLSEVRKQFCIGSAGMNTYLSFRNLKTRSLPLLFVG